MKAIYPCHNTSILFAVCIVILSSLCSYGITEYTNTLQIGLLNLSETPFSYRLLFKISSSIGALIPLMVFLFLYFTTEILLNDFFEEHVEKAELIKIIGIAYMPMLIYQYFFWFNILSYCTTEKIKTVSDFLNMTYIFGLQMNDFEFINTVCWGVIYLIIIIYLFFHNVKILSSLVSVLLPSTIALITYYIISY